MARERILVVDDNPLSLKSARLLLEGEGYEVRTAEDAEQALRAIAESRPALVLMDLQLPGMDGLELTRRLKADPDTRAIVILAFTSYAMKGDEEKALSAGCDGYVTKPVDVLALPRVIERHLGARREKESRRPAAPTILVVEDNSVSRKAARLALESEGYAVVEAPDGRTALEAMRARAPDLVLQDLLLPDMDGFELVERLRALPGGGEVPIIAVSGFLSRMEEGRLPAAGFNDFLSKPLDPQRLADAVAVQLPPASPEPLVSGPRVLAVDDDPVQLKSLRIHLRLAGFQADSASDGQAALERLQSEPFDAVVSDLLMPRLDGFRLCLAIRNDPRLARLPVVLVTSSFVEEPDRRLAKTVGANAFVIRAPGLEETITALRQALESEAPRPTGTPDLPRPEHLDHVIRRLDRQAAQSARLGHRCAVQAAALSVLSGIAEVLAQTHDAPTVLDEILARCIDAGGMSLGALCLAGPDGRLELRAHSGYSEAARPQLESCFDQEPFLRRVLDKGLPVAVPSASVPEETARDLLEKGGVASAVILPITSHGERLGVLLLASRKREFEEEDWLSFARTVAAQVGQAVVLTRAFQRLGASESDLRASNALSEGLFESAPDAVVVTSREGRIVRANRRAEALFGYGREELKGQTVEILVPQRLEASHAEDVARYAAEPRLRAMGTGLELYGRRKDGSEFPADINLGPLKLDGELVVVAVVRDVSERRAAEAALRASEARYRALFEGTLAGVYRATLDGRILDCNEAFAGIFGYASRQEILAQRATDLYAEPETRRGLLDRLRVEGRLTAYESRCRRKDGGDVWVLENASLVEQNGETAVQGTLVDVTERRRLEEQLRQAQKMEAIGQLAGGIAHDFNNLLSVIVGYADLALKDLGQDAPARGRLAGIQKAVERAALLTRQLLTFSRKQVVEPVVLDLSAVVGGLEGMLRRLIREDVQLVTVFGKDLGRVRADRSQLELLIMNLAVNARDAMPKGGRLIIETGNTDLDESYCRQHAGVAPGAYVMLSVTDTGVGMDAATLARIFEPFFTTKEPGKGTGLGLATVYGIVTQAGGHVSVYSEPGRGAAFKIYLTGLHETAEEEPAAESGEPPWGSETILLVEDEGGLREITRETLESFGYTVLAARDGVEALEICNRPGAPVDLLLTDVVMPQMSGPELAEAVTRAWPGIKVLYSSGYPGDTAFEGGRPAGGAAFIQKPFTPSTLARKVREVLDREPPRNGGE